MDERSVPGNGQPSSNSRVHSCSVDKRSRSPPSLDEPDKAVTAVSEKPNEPIAQANPMNVESKAQTLESAAVEKVNLDSFEWPRIYVSLSRKEKEDDFLAMKGTKLPQRPKKRAKNIDRNLQYCFPGMWLSDLSRGRYEVREKKCVKKQKRRGLKGMESVDSDTD